MGLDKLCLESLVLFSKVEIGCRGASKTSDLAKLLQTSQSLGTFCCAACGLDASHLTVAQDIVVGDLKDLEGLRMSNYSAEEMPFQETPSSRETTLMGIKNLELHFMKDAFATAAIELTRIGIAVES